MLKLIFIVYAIFLLNLFVGCEKSRVLRIDLFRQKTPRENALNTKNIEEHGIYLDWLKPHPHPKNFTNISIALFRFLDSEFYGTVKLGSKNKTYNVIYDTAWTTSWIISQDCGKIGCFFHNKYDHSRSDTWRKNGTKYVVDEGSYNMSGYYSTDNINVGGARVDNFDFVEMTDIPYTYIFSKADGVMGLSLPYGNEKTFLARLLEEGTIKKPIFGMYLNRDKESNRGGVILLGDYDPKHIHVGPDRKPEKITYVPVDNSGSGYWEFKMDAVMLEEVKKTYEICTVKCKALVDSGSNAIIGPQKEIEKINEYIHAKHFAFGRYRVDCDTFNKLPKIHFILNGQNFTLTGKQYVQKISILSFQLCISAFMPATSPSETQWILGGSFLSHFYSIYDLERKVIGFVTAA